jgi:hypothetical protein
MSSSSHVDQYSVINCCIGWKFAHICSVEFQNVDIQVWNICSCIVQCYRTLEICLLWHARERKCDKQAGGGIAVILLAIVKAACMQLEVTQIWDHSPCRKVCNQHGVWLISNGRGLGQNVSEMVNLPKFWLQKLLDILHGDCNIFQVNFKMAIAHCCRSQ